MPRFSPEAVGILKSAMASCLPSYVFSPEDVSNIQEKTGLDQTQIQVWADHFRFRVPFDARIAYLTAKTDGQKVGHQVLHCMCAIL